MKILIKKLSIIVLISTMSTAAMAQANWASTLVYAPFKTSQFTKTVKTTNANLVLGDIKKYLGKNINVSSEIMEYYNTEVVIYANFRVSETGEIYNIEAKNRNNAKGNKLFKKAITRALKSLNTVTPVLENGKTIEKDFCIPVIFR